MRRKRRSTTVTVRTLEGKPKAYGLIYRSTPAGAHLGASVPLTVGDTLRFRLFHHDPPDVTERFGKVLWTDLSFDLAAHLVSECRVKWMSASEAKDLGLARRDTETGR